jgi:uncharacterized protein (TIGR02246 family)
MLERANGSSSFLRGILIASLAVCTLFAADDPASHKSSYVVGKLASECSAPEGKPVCEAVERVDRGFRENDAAEIAAAYADDADWTNAVGVHLRGRQNIQKFLSRLLATPEISGSTDSPLDIQTVRFLKPDVAVVYSYLQTTGQKSQKDGKPITLRKTHEMQVLQKFDSDWRIVSDLISDENDAL